MLIGWVVANSKAKAFAKFLKFAIIFLKLCGIESLLVAWFLSLDLGICASVNDLAML